MKFPNCNIKLEFNGETYKKRTSEIKKAILSVKPDVLFTDVYITITFGKKPNNILIERKLNLVQGKRLFLSEDFLEVFVTNLIF